MTLTRENYIQFTDSIGFIKAPTNIGVIVSAIDQSDCREIYLIDAPNTQDGAEQVLSLLSQMYSSFSLKAVLLTHSHADHCGGAPYLKEKTGCEIWASEGEAALLQLPQMEASLIWGSSPIKDLEIPYYIAPKMHSDKIISCNQVYDISKSLSIRFFPLNGHYLAMCGIEVQDNDKKAVFLADGISGRNVIKKYWIQYLFNEQAFKESLLEISKMKADWFIPGHGDFVEDAESLAELNLIAVLETEKLILDILKKGPLSQEDILRLVAIRSGLQMRVNQIVLIGSTLRAYLSSMHKEGLITYEIIDNRMLWKKID